MTKADVKFSGRLPAEKRNGLEPFYEQLLQQGGPSEPVVAVVLIDQDKWAIKKGEDEPSAIARIVAIEGLTGAQATAARKLLTQAQIKRTGDQPLPIEGEEA